MPHPSGYTVQELEDLFTEASDVNMDAHTPDVDTSGGGYTSRPSGDLEVRASDDAAVAKTQQGESNALLGDLDLDGDFLAYLDVKIATGGTLGQEVTWGGGWHFVLNAAPGDYFGLSYSYGSSQLVLAYESTADGYSDTAVYTIPNEAWTTSFQKLGIERRGDTLYAFVNETEEGSLSLAGTDFAGSPTVNPLLTSGNWNTFGSRPEMDNAYIYTKPAPGGLLVPHRYIRRYPHLRL